jgi:hypothetical protein
MKCDWTQKVSLLIDGELPPAEAREAERHVDLCGECRAAREDFLLLRRQLAGYPLELDAFARQRALKRILASSGSDAGREPATQVSRRRESFAGVFGLPRLSPAGLAALLLLLVGIATGVVSLMSARRASPEVASSAPPPAPVNDSNNGSHAATPNTPPVAGDATASVNKRERGEEAAGNNRERAGEEASKGASGNAPGVALPGVRPGLNARRVESAGGRIPKSLPMPTRLDRPRVDAPVAEAARNDAEAVRGAGDDTATRRSARGTEVAEVADGAGGAGESKTARHVEQAQLLLRSFRNVRPAEAGRRASSDLAYEKQRSKKLLYENIVLRREAASRGNLPVESLLDSLEPILIDIANLPDKPAPADIREINERMRRKNLVAMLQISAVESAAARSY